MIAAIPSLEDRTTVARLPLGKYKLHVGRGQDLSVGHFLHGGYGTEHDSLVCNKKELYYTDTYTGKHRSQATKQTRHKQVQIYI